MIRWLLHLRRFARARRELDARRRELVAESSALLIALPTFPDSMIPGVDERVREIIARYQELERAYRELAEGRVPTIPAARVQR